VIIELGGIRLKNMKVFVALILVAFALMLCGCQQDARRTGGTSTIDVDPGKRIIPYTVQWDKNANIWYLTEDAPADYQPKTYVFKESSNLGMMEGEVIIVEHKAGDTVKVGKRDVNETAAQAKKILEQGQQGK
jgi:hypothetical protein